MILWGGFGVQRSLDAETLLWDAQVITDGRLTLSFQRQRESGFLCEACCLTPRHLSLASRDLTLIACWTAFVERRMPPPLSLLLRHKIYMILDCSLPIQDFPVLESSLGGRLGASTPHVRPTPTLSPRHPIPSNAHRSTPPGPSPTPFLTRSIPLHSLIPLPSLAPPSSCPSTRSTLILPMIPPRQSTHARRTLSSATRTMTPSDSIRKTPCRPPAALCFPGDRPPPRPPGGRHLAHSSPLHSDRKHLSPQACIPYILTVFSSWRK